MKKFLAVVLTVIFIFTAAALTAAASEMTAPPRAEPTHMFTWRSFVMATITLLIFGGLCAYGLINDRL